MNKNYPELYDVIEKADFSNPVNLKVLFILLTDFISSIADASESTAKVLIKFGNYLTDNTPPNTEKLISKFNEIIDDINANKMEIEELKKK